MNNIEELAKYTNEVEQLKNQLNTLKEKANDIRWSNNTNKGAELQTIEKQQKELKEKLTNADFKQRIVKNNLYAIAIEAIEQHGYDIVKKYLKRNIGEKTIEKIENEFNAIITPLTNCKISVRHKFYSNVYNNVSNVPCFDFYCSYLNIDTAYYIKDDTFNCCYIMEKVEQIEDVEKEAQKLTSVYYEAIEKLQAYENEMNEYSKKFSENFKRNTYTDNVSRISSKLFYVAPHFN